MSHPVVIEAQRRFDVPLPAAFAYITDLARWPEYWPGLEHVDPESRWQEPGDRARVVLRMIGRRVELQMTLGRLLPCRLVEYTSVQAGLPDAHHERHFEEIDGGFRYRVVVAYEPRRGLRRLFDLVVVRRATRRALLRTLANLDAVFAAWEGPGNRAGGEL